VAQEVLRKALAARMVTGADPLVFGGVDVEAGVFPREQVGELLGADEPGFAEGVEKAMAKELDGGSKVLGGHAVEGSVGSEKAIGGEDMQVGMEDQVVAEGVDGGNGTELAVGEIEAEAKVVAQAFGSGVEEVGEELAAFAEDTPQDLRDGEDELPVRNFVTDGSGNPVAGGADAALVAGGAEVAALAGEGEEALVAAVGTLETGEAGGEVAATKKSFDGGDGLASERAEALAMAGFVLGEEVIPAVVDELPQGRGARAPRLVDGGHK